MLAERSDALLKWARESFAKAGQDVAAQLKDEIADFVRYASLSRSRRLLLTSSRRSFSCRSLQRIYAFINDLTGQSFIKHYIRRSKNAQKLRGCNEQLSDVRGRLMVRFSDSLLDVIALTRAMPRDQSQWQP